MLGAILNICGCAEEDLESELDGEHDEELATEEDVDLDEESGTSRPDESDKEAASGNRATEVADDVVHGPQVLGSASEIHPGMKSHVCLRFLTELDVDQVRGVSRQHEVLVVSILETWLTQASCE